MLRRPLALAVAWTLAWTAPSAPAYAGMGRALSANAGEAVSPALAASWRPVIEDVASQAALLPDSAVSEDIARVLGHIRFELSVHPESSAALSFLPYLRAPAPDAPAALAALEPGDKIARLEPAIREAEERLEERGAELVALSRERELDADEEQEVLRLAGAWFYLKPETSKGILSLSSEIKSEQNAVRFGAMIRRLFGNEGRPETPVSAAKTEVRLLFSGAERLVRENPGALVRDALAPGAAAALRRAEARMQERGHPPEELYKLILRDHDEAFGELAGRGLFDALEKSGEWTEFVSALSILAAEKLGLMLSKRDARRFLAPGGENHDFLLPIPPWHPLASAHETVADWIASVHGEPVERESSQNIHLFTLFGIPVQMGWDFLPTLSLMTYMFTTQAARAFEDADFWMQGAHGVFLSVGITVSMIAHELGHALAARRLGVPARRIVLRWLGAMVVLAPQLRRPGSEMRVALAGPLVNIVLAALAGAAFLGMILAKSLGAPDELVKNVVFDSIWLGVLNAAIAAMNLLPALPLDGGRMLRAALASLTSDYRATRWAAWIGQGFAFLFVAAGTFMLGMTHHFIHLLTIMTGWALLRWASRMETHPGTRIVERNRSPLRGG